jgi:hypothetical protein
MQVPTSKLPSIKNLFTADVWKMSPQLRAQVFLELGFLYKTKKAKGLAHAKTPNL